MPVIIDGCAISAEAYAALAAAAVAAGLSVHDYISLNPGAFRSAVAQSVQPLKFKAGMMAAPFVNTYNLLHTYHPGVTHPAVSRMQLIRANQQAAYLQSVTATLPNASTIKYPNDYLTPVVISANRMGVTNPVLLTAPLQAANKYIPLGLLAKDKWVDNMKIRTNKDTQTVEVEVDETGTPIVMEESIPEPIPEPEQNQDKKEETPNEKPKLFRKGRIKYNWKNSGWLGRVSQLGAALGLTAGTISAITAVSGLKKANDEFGNPEDNIEQMMNQLELMEGITPEVQRTEAEERALQQLIFNNNKGFKLDTIYGN